MSDEPKLTLRQRLSQIGLAYSLFLEEKDLQDTILARMSYLSNVKKAYLRDPLKDEKDQTEILHHLYAWMEETQEEMNAMM